MNNAPCLQKEKSLTREAFNQFLRQLNSDQEDAGAKYLRLRRALILYFEQHGKLSPEILADETLNRIVRALSEGTKIDSLNSYALTVARNVLGENGHNPQTSVIEVEELQSGKTSPLNRAKSEQKLDLLQSEQARLECMKKCLKELSAEDYRLVQQYYAIEYISREEERKQLAAQIGVSFNTLRDRLHHIRAALELCLNDCLG